MKHSLGAMFGGVVLLALLIYAIYVASGNGTCARIERGTDWLKWSVQGAQAAVRPWLDDGTLASMHAGGVDARLGFAAVLQRYNANIRCPWDGATAPAAPRDRVSLPPLPARNSP